MCVCVCGGASFYCIYYRRCFSTILVASDVHKKKVIVYYYCVFHVSWDGFLAHFVVDHLVPSLLTAYLLLPSRPPDVVMIRPFATGMTCVLMELLGIFEFRGGEYGTMGLPSGATGPR